MPKLKGNRDEEVRERAAAESGPWPGTECLQPLVDWSNPELPGPEGAGRCYVNKPSDWQALPAAALSNQDSAAALSKSTQALEQFLQLHADTFLTQHSTKTGGGEEPQLYAGSPVTNELSPFSPSLSHSLFFYLLIF